MMNLLPLIISIFDMLADPIRGNINILFISKKRSDETFLSSNPRLFSPIHTGSYRKGEVLYYISEKVSLRKEYLLNFLQMFFCISLLYKKKLLIGSTYNPCGSMISNHLDILTKCIDQFLPKYENFYYNGGFYF